MIYRAEGFMQPQHLRESRYYVTGLMETAAENITRTHAAAWAYRCSKI